MEGTLRFPSCGVGLSASPAGIRRLPPRLGEHTAEVLAEAGLSDEELRRLAEAGVTVPVEGAA